MTQTKNYWQENGFFKITNDFLKVYVLNCREGRCLSLEAIFLKDVLRKVLKKQKKEEGFRKSNARGRPVWFY